MQVPKHGKHCHVIAEKSREMIINQPKPRITGNGADHGASGGEKHRNKSKVKLPWDFNFNEVKNSDYLK